MIKIRLLIFMILASLITISCWSASKSTPPPPSGVAQSFKGGINEELNNPDIDQ
ncbi:MAG: hypothetical protein K940chlam1_00150 [Candidatus Anoxychlamydiales bacterium]|nr:hypothetical protein [Candidatus Anoxychlamydiales bacterium]NGX35625.1 hypothetical protein [Candidatus Anoxychlamydiales bacterium]